MSSVTLKGRRVAYCVRASSKASRMRIKVSPRGIEVVTPTKAEPERITQFLKKNSRWVLDQLDFIKRAGGVRVKAPATGASTVLLRGNVVDVYIVRDEKRRGHPSVRLVDGRIRIAVAPRRETEAGAALARWLRRQARRDITERVAARSKEMRQKPGRVYIRAQRTRWGSCTARHNLAFNWRLVMAPPEVLDYIVVHEIAHLAVPDHSTKFWLTVRSYCPDFERHRRWLRENEPRLMKSVENYQSCRLRSSSA